MYKCELCKKISELGEGLNRVPVSRRTKRYVNKIKTKTRTRTIESTGWEIVKELKICKICKETGEFNESICN